MLYQRTLPLALLISCVEILLNHHVGHLLFLNLYRVDIVKLIIDVCIIKRFGFGKKGIFTWWQFNLEKSFFISGNFFDQFGFD